MRIALAFVVALATALFARAVLAHQDSPTINETIDLGHAGPPPPASSDGGGPGPSTESIEILDEGPDGGAAKTAPTKAAPPEREKLEFRGFTRFTTGVGLYPSGVEPVGATFPERVAYERWFQEEHLYLDLRYLYGRRFQAVTSASLQFEAFRVEGRPGNPLPQDDRFEYRLPQAYLREAYVGVFLGDRVDLRLGQQRIAWGISDAFTPNDVLNARDRRNPFLFDTEMLNQPTPALRADLDAGLAVVSLVVQPFFIPDRFDFYGTNWALIQPRSPKPYRRLYGFLSNDRDRNSFATLQDLQTESQRPEGLSGTSVGASLKAHLGKVDTSFYYQYGYDRSPAVYMDTAFANQLSNIDPNTVDGVILDALLKSLKSSSAKNGAPLVLSYVRRHHVGFDASTAVGPIVLRLEGAYDTATTFYSIDAFSSRVRPQAQGVFGIEYTTGDTKKLLALEISYLRLLDPPVSFAPLLSPSGGGQLLFYDDDNVNVAGLARWTFFDHLSMELRTIGGIKPAYYSVPPEIGYGSDPLPARIGLLASDGPANP